jgi:hypothetical protein
MTSLQEDQVKLSPLEDGIEAAEDNLLLKEMGG